MNCKRLSMSMLYVLLLFFNLHAAENISIDSVMELFAQNTEESTIETDSAVIASRARYLEWKKNAPTADSLRVAIRCAFEQKRYDDLKKIVADAEKFEKEKNMKRIFWTNDRILLKYYVKDFEFLSNVDSVSKIGSTSSLYGIYADTLRSQIESGEFEETLKEVENESDRIFIRLLLIKMINYNVNISELILENKSKLTKMEQLHYLVDHYWDMERMDKHEFVGISVGISYSHYLEDVSKYAKSGFAANHDYNGSVEGSAVKSNFLHEMFIDWDFGDYKDDDSLDFYDMNLDYNFGYTFLNMEYLHLYAYLSLGYGKNRLLSDEKEYSYVSYGAGGMADVLFTKRRLAQFGVRLRTGIKNINANEIIDASGYRWYASVGLVILFNKEKKMEFEY